MMSNTQLPDPIFGYTFPRSTTVDVGRAGGSRSSTSTNQPYLGLTVGSIVARCKNDFNVCAVTDRSFADLLPNWCADLSKVGDPVRTKLRQLAMARLLSKYGGMVVPCGFVCYRSLKPAYDTAMLDTGMIVFESNKTCGADCSEVMLSQEFMGCRANSRSMQELCALLEEVASADFTEASVFEGRIAKHLRQMQGQREITAMPGCTVGVVDDKGKLVTPERLMQEQYIPFRDHIYGILIPEKQLLKRKEYGWLPQLEPIDAVQADCVLGKSLLLGLS